MELDKNTNKPIKTGINYPLELDEAEELLQASTSSNDVPYRPKGGEIYVYKVCFVFYLL